MPIYEFVCESCKDLFELLVKNPNEPVALACPRCGSSTLQRVVSRVNAVIADGGGQAATVGSGPGVENRSCPSGNCTTLNLPGHSRSS